MILSPICPTNLLVLMAMATLNLALAVPVTTSDAGKDVFSDGVSSQRRSQQVSSAGGTTVQILGRSGKMTVSNSNLGSSSVTVTMDALREVDTSGNAVGTTGNPKHSFNTFASQDFTFSPASTVQYQNMTASYIDFTSTINSGTFQVLTYVFQDTGTITHDSEESKVGNGTLKFSVSVTGWNWCTGSNCQQGQTQQTGSFLDFDISIKGSQAPTAKPKANPNLDAANQTKDYNIGNAVVGLSTRVKVDGAWVTMPTGYPKVATQGSSTVYTFRFPKGNAILYDPTIGGFDTVVVVNSGSAHGSTPGSLLVTIFILASARLFFFS